MFRKLKVLLGLAMSLTLSSSSSAAFILGVDASIASPAAPGSSGFINVFVNNTGAAALVDTVQINLNLGATGPANLGQFSYTGPVQLAPGTPIDDFFTPSSTSLFSANSFPASSIGAGRTDLFRIPFTISPGANGGAFTFDIVGVGGGGFVTRFENGGASLNPDFSALPEFTLSVTTVPEPASLALCGLTVVGIGGVVRRFRARKQSVAA